ncbi:MAG: L-rhamnose isomerase [Clostridia bacterium]|nr:L-rhamnose isomerase [Clostridia bacterium]
MGLVTENYKSAKEKYNEIGIDTEDALEKLKKVVFSLKCCDAIDIENRNDTSDYRSEHRSSPKVRQSLEKALKMIPGKHRVCVNALHMDTEEYVELDEIEACHYEKWISWAKVNTCGIDLFTSMLRHEKSDKGFALANLNKDLRYFWVEHCQRCRIVGEYIGQQLGSECITTISINDFFESVPVESVASHELLIDSLNKIYAEKRNKNFVKDSLVTGLNSCDRSIMPLVNENFCVNYSVKNNLYTTVEISETSDEKEIYQKINSASSFSDKIIVNLLPGSSKDNMITLNDTTINLATHIVHNNLLERVQICLDFKTKADELGKVKNWVLGARAMQKAYLTALLEPGEYLKRCDAAEDYSTKQALIDEINTYPFGAVWDYFCLIMNVPVGMEWLDSGNHMSG